MLSSSKLYQTDRKIWKILLDEQAEYAVLEVRDEDLREAFFVAIDWASGEVLWDEGYLEEDWWISLAAVSQGKLFAHLLHEDQEPTPKALIALNIQEAAGLWEVKDTALLNAAPTALLVSQDGKQAYLDPNTGDPLSPSLSFQQAAASWQMPARYLAEEEHFRTVATFLQKKGHEAVHAIDYWETDRHLCISFYEMKGIYFQNQLLVLNRQGEELFRTVLQEGAKGIGTEAFAIQGPFLFYIQHKNTLQRLSLA